MKKGASMAPAICAAATYAEVYTNVGLLAIGVGVVLFQVSPLLRKGMHGVH